ncbi:MAG: hypothetical protein LUQ11_03220, partial [Methylococcaceae bacterium]|nr:hypothetical protein [Methylococcaceae bacterium]
NIKPDPIIRDKKLAGLEAAEISFHTRDQAAVRVVIFRSRNDAVPIIYTLGLDIHGSRVKQDKKLLNRIIRSFSLLPLPK